MTTQPVIISAITSIVADLPKDVPTTLRYQRLLTSLQKIIPFDAVAIMKLEIDQLTPLATLGLRDDVMGRRFVIDEHPRLAKIMSSTTPVHFDVNSELSDPFDGLFGDEDCCHDVHDCMGIPLFINNKIWGLLSLDAQIPGTFDHIEDHILHTIICLTEAAIGYSHQTEALAASTQNSRISSQAVLLNENPSEIIGNSDAMLKLKNELDIVAQSHLSVLVLGETGVGKELVARQVHDSSPRASEPLVYVNCAALPENIAESELFGHKKGAFSGAVTDRAGKFEIADGGTLFLDEIGELPLAIQPKLLRALQSGEIQRVGSDEYNQVNVRIIAATNRDLHQETLENRFRADLYHRLSVYPITVPPLRERDRDILLLAGYLLEINQKRLGAEGLRITHDAKQALLHYSWPGNVRELEHMISRSALKAISEQGRKTRSILINASHLDIPNQFGNENRNGTSTNHSANNSEMNNSARHNGNEIRIEPVGLLKDAVDEFQRQFIFHTLETHDGNQAAAARALGINRSNFYRLIKRLLD